MFTRLLRRTSLSSQSMSRTSLTVVHPPTDPHISDAIPEIKDSAGAGMADAFRSGPGHAAGSNLDRQSSFERLFESQPSIPWPTKRARGAQTPASISRTGVFGEKLTALIRERSGRFSPQRYLDERWRD